MHHQLLRMFVCENRRVSTATVKLIQSYAMSHRHRLDCPRMFISSLASWQRYIYSVACMQSHFPDHIETKSVRIYNGDTIS